MRRLWPVAAIATVASLAATGAAGCYSTWEITLQEIKGERCVVLPASALADPPSSANFDLSFAIGPDCGSRR